MKLIIVIASLLAYTGLAALMVIAINKPAPSDALIVPLIMLMVCMLCVLPWAVLLGLTVSKPGNNQSEQAPSLWRVILGAIGSIGFILIFAYTIIVVAIGVYYSTARGLPPPDIGVWGFALAMWGSSLVVAVVVVNDARHDLSRWAHGRQERTAQMESMRGNNQGEPQ